MKSMKTMHSASGFFIASALLLSCAAPQLCLGATTGENFSASWRINGRVVGSPKSITMYTGEKYTIEVFGTPKKLTADGSKSMRFSVTHPVKVNLKTPIKLTVTALAPQKSTELRLKLYDERYKLIGTKTIKVSILQNSIRKTAPSGTLKSGDVAGFAFAHSTGCSNVRWGAAGCGRLLSSSGTSSRIGITSGGAVRAFATVNGVRIQSPILNTARRTFSKGSKTIARGGKSGIGGACISLKSVKYSSSNSRVAQVSSGGVIYGKTAGRAVITATGQLSRNGFSYAASYIWNVTVR